MVSEPSLVSKLEPSPITESAPRRTFIHSRQIPWGYGRDRVTAIAVDPDRLFVYWEVRDESLDAARERLGPAGARAALVMRVYDTSGRIFDGENAHSYFDQDVQRNDRQWFCHVGKPSSSAHVEMGLRTPDGRFLKLMRSGRVDFPRKEPAGWRPPEWMRVVASTGDITSRETSATTGHGAGAEPAAGGLGGDGGAAPAVGFDGGGVTTLDRFETVEYDSYEVKEFNIERFETDTGWQIIDAADPATVYRMVTMSWQELGMGVSTWESGPTATSWESGPFSYPTEVIIPVVERHEGPTHVYRQGEQVRVMHGPWQVVIRGINAHSSRRVLGRWEVHRSWLGVGIRAAESPIAYSGAPVGASERFLAASELRLKGASEVFYLGASERRLGGASELRFLAASQWIARGASERRLSGASEYRFAGASELRFAGASERLRLGGSERRLSGASERRLRKGASEQRLRGASEARLGGGSESRLADGVSSFPPAPSRKG